MLTVTTRIVCGAGAAPGLGFSRDGCARLPAPVQGGVLGVWCVHGVLEAPPPLGDPWDPTHPAQLQGPGQAETLRLEEPSPELTSINLTRARSPARSPGLLLGAGRQGHSCARGSCVLATTEPLGFSLLVDRTAVVGTGAWRAAPRPEPVALVLLSGHYHGGDSRQEGPRPTALLSLQGRGQVPLWGSQ